MVPCTPHTMSIVEACEVPSSHARSQLQYRHEYEDTCFPDARRATRAGFRACMLSASVFGAMLTWNLPACVFEVTSLEAALPLHHPPHPLSWTLPAVSDQCVDAWSTRVTQSALG